MKIKIFYEKTRALRYTSVLDLQKIWERSFRRASLQVEMSQGFKPHPKIQILNPLPVGFTGRDEAVDIQLEQEYAVEWIQENLQRSLPDGIQITRIENISGTSINKTRHITASEYKVTFFDADSKTLRRKIDDLLQTEQVIRIRNGKQYDLRPLIQHIEISDGIDGSTELLIQLSALPGRTGRPDEVVQELGYELTDCLIERTRIF